MSNEQVMNKNQEKYYLKKLVSKYYFLIAFNPALTKNRAINMKGICPNV